MELKRIKIEKFKKVIDVDFELSHLNVLVGANGSGKSSIIQAIHLASCLIRQADRIREESTSAVGVTELDYLPSNAYPELGHGTSWGNKKGTPSSKVSFTFNSEGDEYTAWAEIRAARNAGISITGNIPDRALVTMMRTKTRFFSAYIPGVSGIRNHEQKQSKRVVLRACSYGDSNIYLRNILNLLKESEGSIEKLEGWLSDIIGDVKIHVDHDDEKHLTIDAKVEVNDKKHPIELIGTGYIQLIQIFSYVLLFKPKILLIDEPDIHLHPNIQEKLSKSLTIIAQEMDLKVLMTTHSPFIVRGAPVDAKVLWVNDGQIDNVERGAIELTLGWGASGKKLLLISEDSKTELLKKLISQWPELEKFVVFYPGGGYKTLPNPEQAKEISQALGGAFKVLVHRDRDSLTDDEASTLSTLYENEGIHLWLPVLSDVESYFCDATFLNDLLGCDAGESQPYIDAILSRHATPIRDQFNKQRAAHNEELHKEGGSPTNEDVWSSFQTRPLQGAKGKFVFNQLKNAVPRGTFTPEAIQLHTFSVEIATDLKTKICSLLED